MDANQLRLNFLRKLNRTVISLRIRPSTALILLVKNNWNETLLASKVNNARVLAEELLNCVPQVEAIKAPSECAVCHGLDVCTHLNCGHQVCGYCLDESVHNQVAEENLLLTCPAQDCHICINITNLSEELMQGYVGLLESHLHENTPGSLVRCLKFVWEKKLPILSGVIVIYGMYKGYCHKDNIRKLAGCCNKDTIWKTYLVMDASMDSLKNTLDTWKNNMLRA